MYILPCPKSLGLPLSLSVHLPMLGHIKLFFSLFGQFNITAANRCPSSVMRAIHQKRKKSYSRTRTHDQNCLWHHQGSNWQFVSWWQSSWIILLHYLNTLRHILKMNTFFLPNAMKPSTCFICSVSILATYLSSPHLFYQLHWYKCNLSVSCWELSGGPNHWWSGGPNH